MSLLLDSFWRAVAYCLHPRVIVLSLLPLVGMLAVAVALGYFFWDSAVNSVFLWLESTHLFVVVGDWLTSIGLRDLKKAVAPLIVVFGITPLVVVGVLLLVALLMTPAVLGLVARRRFPSLERKGVNSFLRGLGWSLGSTLLALVAMLLSIPLWLVPPLILVLPPVIWGWLTYRVMAYDALASHATTEERRTLFRQHRLWLLGMGIATGFLGAAPSVLWASGWFFFAAFPIIMPLAIWIYTLVFAFASLWFAHYCLAALASLRASTAIALPDVQQSIP